VKHEPRVCCMKTHRTQLEDAQLHFPATHAHIAPVITKRRERTKKFCEFLAHP
jgi:hypothetical protein